jgi:RHS repeat-associated protein
MSGTPIAAENPWRFSSKRQDPTTDWVHYEFRVYDPSSGRWLSRDPIGEAGGENLYGFVGNNPLGAVDALGLAAISYLAGFGWDGDEADEYETSIGEFCLSAWEGVKCFAEEVKSDFPGAREKLIEGMSDRYATVIDLYGEWAVWAFVVNDVTGATTLVEGASGIDLITQQYLTEEERTERQLTGGGQLLLTITGPLAQCERAAARQCASRSLSAAESFSGTGPKGSCCASAPRPSAPPVAQPGLPQCAAKPQVLANQAAGNAARDAIAATRPGSLIEQNRRVTGGLRRIDVLDGRMAIESKVGRTCLSKDVTRELARDIKMLRAGLVDSVEWHFSPSPTTGKVGPTRPLRAKLNKFGIGIVE